MWGRGEAGSAGLGLRRLLGLAAPARAASGLASWAGVSLGRHAILDEHLADECLKLEELPLLPDDCEIVPCGEWRLVLSLVSLTSTVPLSQAAYAPH